MKSFTRFSVIALMLAFTSSALAVDLNTNAVVDIVEGIVLAETQAMDFGSLSLNDGAVVLAAAGTYTDANSLMFDDTSVAAGDFTITSVAAADVTVTLTAGAPPAGLALTAFTVDVAAGTTTGASPQGHTMVADTDALLVGCTLTVTKATATVADDQNIPYTVGVVFQ